MSEVQFKFYMGLVTGIFIGFFIGLGGKTVLDNKLCMIHCMPKDHKTEWGKCYCTDAKNWEEIND